MAKSARAVVDFNLADLKASGRRQYRNKSVEFAVKLNVLDDLTAIELEPTVMVVEAAAGELADHGIEDA